MSPGSDSMVTRGFVECPIVAGDGDSGSVNLRGDITCVVLWQGIKCGNLTHFYVAWWFSGFIYAPPNA